MSTIYSFIVVNRNIKAGGLLEWDLLSKLMREAFDFGARIFFDVKTIIEHNKSICRRNWTNQIKRFLLDKPARNMDLVWKKSIHPNYIKKILEKKKETI